MLDSGRLKDESLGNNTPLITAEFELSTKEAHFYKPDRLCKDVTDNHRYKDNNLTARIPG